jgi:hypothetical protein
MKGVREVVLAKQHKGTPQRALFCEEDFTADEWVEWLLEKLGPQYFDTLQCGNWAPKDAVKAGWKVPKINYLRLKGLGNLLFDQ